MGETVGPGSQIGLRRNPPFDGLGDLRSFIQGIMLARGAQTKSDTGEATVPAATEVICFHTGGRPSVVTECRKIFRLLTSKSDGVDCCEKLVSVVFNEETMRARKKRIRGSDAYTCQTSLGIYSGRTLVPDVVPEKRRPHYQGYNTGDVVGFVDALAMTEQWETSRALKEKILGPKAMKLTTSEATSSLTMLTTFSWLFFKLLSTYHHNAQ